jgi:ATP-dependent DNA helicase 2 subunit 2
MATVPIFSILRNELVLIFSAISAIVIAIQMITKHCKKLKWKRRIVLVTDGRGSMDADPDGIAEISKKVKEDEMELIVV